MSDVGPRGEGDPTALITAHFLLPEQDGPGNITNRAAEFGLLWAVFTDGIRAYCEEILKGSTGSFTYREVHRWIFREESDAITSFSSLCELFRIDTRSLRRALLRFREHPTAGILNVLVTKVA